MSNKKDEKNKEVYIDIEQLIYDSDKDPNFHIQFNRLLNVSGFDKFKISIYTKGETPINIILTGESCLEFAMGMKSIILNALTEKTDFMVENAVNQANYLVSKETTDGVI